MSTHRGLKGVHLRSGGSRYRMAIPFVEIHVRRRVNLMVCPRPNNAPFAEMVKKDIVSFLHYPKPGSAKTKETDQELDHMPYVVRTAKGRESYLSRHRDEYHTFVLQQYFGDSQTSIPWVLRDGQVNVCSRDLRQVNTNSCATVYFL